MLKQKLRLLLNQMFYGFVRWYLPSIALSLHLLQTLSECWKMSVTLRDFRTYRRKFHVETRKKCTLNKNMNIEDERKRGAFQKMTLSQWNVKLTFYSRLVVHSPFYVTSAMVENNRHFMLLQWKCHNTNKTYFLIHHHKEKEFAQV